MSLHSDVAASEGSEGPGTNGKFVAQRRATLHDIARAAGVSVASASRVVRNDASVSPGMRTRVQSAIDELGYRPHAGARTLRGKSYEIGIVLTDLRSAYQSEVAQAIDDELEGTAYDAVLVAGGTRTERQVRKIEGLLDRQVDGIVLVAPWVDAGWIEQVALRVPLVAVAMHGPSKHFDTVVDDERLGARLAVDHLVSLGHRRILHTSMPHSPVGENFALAHTARRQGFEHAMAGHGLVADVIETWFDEEGGRDAAREALSRPSPPTAIFAGADIAALGVLRAADDAEVRVPDDLAVVGYDNIYDASISRVALTTVDQSGKLLGAAAARMLQERMAGRTEVERYVMAPRLVVRATTAAPRMN